MSALRGTAVSPGLAVGRALVVERDAVPVFRLNLASDEIPAEIGRLEAALEVSREQLRAIKERLSR
jgi:phosphoenolpyruvate-protein kinase (PTS system EI component)